MAPNPNGPVPSPAGMALISSSATPVKDSIPWTPRSTAPCRKSCPSGISMTQKPMPRPVNGPRPRGPVPSNPGMAVSFPRFPAFQRPSRSRGGRNSGHLSADRFDIRGLPQWRRPSGPPAPTRVAWHENRLFGQAPCLKLIFPVPARPGHCPGECNCMRAFPVPRRRAESSLPGELRNLCQSAPADDGNP